MTTSEISSVSPRAEGLWIGGIFAGLCAGLAIAIGAYAFMKERDATAEPENQTATMAAPPKPAPTSPTAAAEENPPLSPPPAAASSVPASDLAAMEAWWQQHHQMEMWWELHRMEMWWALRQHPPRRPGGRRPSPPSTAAIASAAERSWGEAADVYEPPRYLLDTTRWPVHGPADGR